MVDVLREVAKLRGAQRTFVDQSPVGDSQGNGVAERAVQTIEKLIRIHKLAFERKVKCKLSVTHALFPWLVEFCADLYNRFQIGSDGKTAMQRLRGRRCNQPFFEFAAPVLFRVCGKVQGSVMTERWFSGVFLGKKPGTDEYIVMRDTGQVVRARAVKEMAKKMTLDDYAVLVGQPHDPLGALKTGERDGGRPAELHGPSRDLPEDGDVRPTPKRVQITREVVIRFGATPGCRKCRGVLARDASYQFVHHSNECRARMEEKMAGDDSFKKNLESAEMRRMTRIAEMLEKADQAEKKRRAPELSADCEKKNPINQGGRPDLILYVTVKDVKLNLDSKAVTEETNKETHEELEEIRIPKEMIIWEFHSRRRRPWRLRGKEIARKKLNQNEMPLGGGLAWDSTLWRRSLISRRSSVQLG